MPLRRWLLSLSLVLAGLVLLAGRQALAQDEGDDDRNPIDERCLGCHGDSEATLTFENGEVRSVDVDAEAFDASMHGVSNPGGDLSCYDCHGNYTYPHQGGPWETPRDFRLDMNAVCEDCHAYQADLQQDSTHALAMAAGNRNAAVCVDCHGYHATSDPEVPRADISRTCGTCHTEVFDTYAHSVHGAALLDDSNPDVPTCVNCHGVHNIQDPTTNLFRLRSPELCAQCHADEELMDKYGISTHVFETYVADFHGTTVTLFAHETPDAEVNTAVCYDCHGVHNILGPEDPQSTVAKQNLVQTCRRCHPDATANFPDAWTKHYFPSREKYPIVFFVDQFYKVFIPGILGFFAIVMIPDAIRRIIDGRQHALAAREQAQAPAEEAPPDDE